jgi:PQQ-like domain
MKLTRRTFNRGILPFLIGTAMPPILLRRCQPQSINSATSDPIRDRVETHVKAITTALVPDTELLIPTYLGSDRRKFYGRGVPQSLNLQHQFPLGSGRSYLGGRFPVWSGAGWTGQPTIAKDGGKTYLIIGSFDHHLRKIDLETNQVVWQYKFDDILKGSSTIYIDPTAPYDNQVVVLQGSRRGVTGKHPSSFRAISFRTGREIWRLSLQRTPSYSLDNDSSPIDLGDGVLFNAGENSIGYFLNSATSAGTIENGMWQPEILSKVQLYKAEDAPRYGGNLVTESSPARLGDRLFIAAGGGHIYGISLETRQIIWHFLAGGDLDGTIAISQDDKLFCALEKERIPGNGGLFKLNPNLPPEQAVEWFFPTGNRSFSTWLGGVIGSVALNDEYRTPDRPALFATNSIDGHLYIGSQHQIDGQKVKGPFLNREYETPVIAFKQLIGPSISTPIFTDGDRLIAAGYNGVYLFQLNFDPTSASTPQAVRNDKGEYFRLVVEQVSHFKPGISFESTPIVWDGLVRICARDGWMYTLGG